MNFKKIDDHMKNKFLNYEKIEKLSSLPNKSELQSMSDNIVYKVPMVTVAVDIIDFKKINQYSSVEDIALLMSEFTYGVTSIMKDYGAQYIEVQGDGIFCNLPASYRKEIDNAFNMACALNTFKKHIIKSGKHHNLEIKKSGSSYSYGLYGNTNDTFEFDFGIALVASLDNHITKAGKGNARDLIFLGRSVNTANALAKESSRNGNSEIMFDENTYANFSDELREKIDNSRVWNRNMNINGTYETVHGLSGWIITNYDNYILNNVGGDNE